MRQSALPSARFLRSPFCRNFVFCLFVSVPLCLCIFSCQNPEGNRQAARNEVVCRRDSLLCGASRGMPKQRRVRPLFFLMLVLPPSIGIPVSLFSSVRALWGPPVRINPECRPPSYHRDLARTAGACHTGEVERLCVVSFRRDQRPSRRMCEA